MDHRYVCMVENAVHVVIVVDHRYVYMIESAEHAVIAAVLGYALMIKINISVSFAAPTSAASTESSESSAHHAAVPFALTGSFARSALFVN